MDILEELKRLITKLNEQDIGCDLCGGLAMAMTETSRSTQTGMLSPCQIKQEP